MALRCSVRRKRLAAVAGCFFVILVITFSLPHTGIFITVAKIDYAIKKQLGLVINTHSVVFHRQGCSTGNIFCSEIAGHAVKNVSHDVNYIFPGMVSSNMTSSSHNVSLVLLGEQLRNGDGSSRHETGTACAPASTDVNRTLFRSRKLVIWSTDHHPAPAYDAKCLLQPLGVKFLQHDLSPYCSYFSVCLERNSLKVINAQNMFSLDPALIPKFYAAYKNDPIMQSVDAFLCYDPPAICELYAPFNKSLIIIASNRYYITRQTKERWTTWNNNLVRYAPDPRNVIAANNRYDVEMIRYFTGLEAKWIPNFAAYTKTTYNPSRKGFLLSKRRVDAEFEWLFLFQFMEACKSLNRSRPISELIRIKQRYPKYRYADLAAHQGIVHLPYQVSTMSIFEHYRMNIPLFFPSKELLLKWSIERWVVRERTLPWMVRDPRPHTFPPHPSQRHVPSPNDNDDAAAMNYWLKFADYYTLPHITYFNSTEHLAVILQRLTEDDLKTISLQMKKFNDQFRKQLLKKWKRILLNVAKFSPNHPY